MPAGHDSSAPFDHVNPARAPTVASFRRRICIYGKPQGVR